MKTDTWQPPTTLRGYLGEIRGVFDTILYTMRLADSKDVRPWMYQKYLAALVSIFLAVFLSRRTALVLQEATAHNSWGVKEGMLYVGVIFLTQKALGLIFWRAHEYAFGLSFKNIKTRVLDAFFEKSPGQHKHIRSLNYESVMKGVSRASELYDNHTRELFEIVFSLAFVFTSIWTISPASGHIYGVAVLAYTLVTLYVNYKLLVATSAIEEDFSSFERYYAQLLRLFPRIYVSGKRGAERKRMRELWSDVATRDRKAYVSHGWRVTIQDTIMAGAILLVLYKATMTVATGSGASSITLLFPLFAWSMQLSNDLARLRGVERNIYKCIPAIAVMRKTLAIQPDVVDREGAKVLQVNGPLTLEFRNVSYAYPGSEETLSGINLRVDPGKTVALVGPSGAGKSTLDYLILRFMNPTTGQVLLDEQDVQDLTIESVLAQIGYVPQKPLIFDGTVRENLVYSLSDEELKQWDDKRLLELMADLAIDFGVRPADENPLDIVVGRDGVELSGGQAQRLAIGAVVIKQPKLMIVDEATSALDTATETQLLEGLRKWIDGSGMLVIAHRLSTVRDADTIVVLADGKVEAIGHSFDELVAISPTFRRLIDGQGHLLA